MKNYASIAACLLLLAAFVPLHVRSAGRDLNQFNVVGGTPPGAVAPTTVGTRTPYGYTYITNAVPYAVNLALDDCDIYNAFSAGDVALAQTIYVQGKNAIADGLSYNNISVSTFDEGGEMYNDIIVAGLGTNGINEAFFAGEWKYNWGPLNSGVRTPWNTLVFAAKAKEMLHQIDLSYRDVLVLQGGNLTELTGAGTHPFAALRLDYAFAMWAGNATNPCPDAMDTMAAVSNFMATDMHTLYRGLSLQNSAMERAFNEAQYAAKRADSATVLENGVMAASIVIEFGLQAILHNAYVKDFGSACGVSEVIETGLVSARDYVPLTVTLLTGLVAEFNETQTQNPMPAIQNFNDTILGSSFTYSEAAEAIEEMIALLPDVLGLDYTRLGSPPATPTLPDTTNDPFWWLYSAFPNCTALSPNISSPEGSSPQESSPAM